MPVPSFDPRPQNEPLLPEIKAAFARILETGKFIGGEHVEQFERDFAAAVEVEHATAVSSGTDALLVALMALGIGPGDGVVTTPFTFFATAGTVRRLGAVPLFADVDPATLNLSPQRVDELLARTNGARSKGPRAKALLPVHLFGRAAPMGELGAIAEKHGLAVVEDVAQAFGARHEGAKGRLVGSIGRVGCFSFYPTKNLGGMGDGGAVTTHDGELDRRIKALRNHGQGVGGVAYEHGVVGGNFRLDTLQCVALRAKLPHVARWNAERASLARRYVEGFKAKGVLGLVRPPDFGPDGEHVFHQFVVRLARRDDLQKFLKERSIGSAVYYPLPLHLQPCFRELGHKSGDFPESEKAAREVLALPMFPGLAPSAVDEVVAAIADFARGAKA
jgi:dTDP-4-amino-4,6-dideoxygalactose transaminase